MNRKKGNKKALVPGVDFVVKKVQLERINLNFKLSGTECVDCHDLHRIISENIKHAKTESQQPLQLLAGLTNYHVEPDHRTEPFKPMLIMYDRRSLIPSDFLPEQISILAEFAPKVTNSGLRARIADVVWFIQRNRQDLANLAISSYCDCLDQVQAGNATFAFNNRSPRGVSARELLNRAASISYATGWKLSSSERLRELIHELVATAFKNHKPMEFVRIANVDVNHQISSVTEIAAWSEKLACSDALLKEPDQRIYLWKTAARCYRCMQDEENYIRCMTEIAECHVQKAGLAESPMVTADFLSDAIQVLQRYPGTEKRRDELMVQLRHVQPSIRDTMGTFSTEIDLSDFVEHSVASVRGCSWPKAFLSLVLCDLPPDPDDIYQQAQKHKKDFPVQSTVPVKIYDFQGRVVFQSHGLTGTAEQKREHFRFLMSLLRGFSRQVLVGGAIIPIRRMISEEHLVSVDIIQAMIKDSPFIPAGHDYIFARAIVQFLAGEDTEAASLLVPQLENSLRHILAQRGIDTTTANISGIQTEATLSVLLNTKKPWRAELEKILPKRYIHEIDLLFNFAGGPSLRNQVAHGKVPVSKFESHDMVYALWLIIQIAILPLANRWGNVEEVYAQVTGLTKPKSEDS